MHHTYHLEDEQTKLVKTSSVTGERIVLFENLDPKFALTFLAEIQLAYFQGRFDANLTTGRITAANRAEAKRPPKNNFL
jgi:hypothetical protein